MKVWDEVEKSYRSGSTVRGRVIDRIKGGLAVDIGVKAFLPGSLVDVKPVKNLESLRGKDFDFKVISVDKKRGNIVLSRKAVVEVEQEAKKRETLQILEEGRVLRGTVKNLTDYGAFVDLGRARRPPARHRHVLGPGQPPLRPRQGRRRDRRRRSQVRPRDRARLARHQAADRRSVEPRAEKYPAGSRVSGRVTNVTDYGAFVELEEGVEGLIHVSEMSWSKKVKNPSKVVSPATRSRPSSPTSTARRAASRCRSRTRCRIRGTACSRSTRSASRVSGKVRNLTDFGAFVEIEEGIDGLVHVSDMSWTEARQTSLRGPQEGGRRRGDHHVDRPGEPAHFALDQGIPARTTGRLSARSTSRATWWRGSSRASRTSASSCRSTASWRA